MAKGISISLAAKCQLLFGLAVLVIIAGALAVPWQRMEQLAGQQNIKAARMLADATFRQVHIRTDGSAVSAATAPARAGTTESGAGTEPDNTQPAATGANTTPGPLHWRDIALVDIADYPQPQIITLKSLEDDLPGEDRVIRDAIELFRAHPTETEHGGVVTVGKEKARVYRYAAAIRLDKSCLGCHTEWTGWLRPAPTPDATGASFPPAPAVSPTTTASAGSALSLPTNPGLAPPAGWPIVGVVRVDLPWQIDESQLLLNRIVIAVAGMFGGTLAIVVFYLITNRLILQPVRVLKNTAEKVSMGDLNIRSAISTGDEFQQLSEMFNHMLATLQASQDQLESTNSSLDTRVGELAQSNVDLYEANRLKSEFLTNVSHELRTPLNAIIGFTDLLAENPATKTDAKLSRYAENIKHSAKQLLDLINDLLDLAKIEAGKLVLRPEKVSVTEVCEAMLNFMKPLAQKKNIEMVLSAPDPLPLMTTDPGRFQQILYNFLSNAVKFTPNDGRITLAARLEPPPRAPAPTSATADAAPVPVPEEPVFIRISVTDTGPGIPFESQQQIFEKFRQIDGSVTRQHSGTGLGLAISRELAAMLGARIELISAPGKGATFSLIIPTELPRKFVDVHVELENK